MSEKPDFVQSSQENYRTEYGAVASGYRFFVSLRFITVAFAMTLQSTLLTLYSQSIKNIANDRFGGFAIISIGIFIISAILIVEWRTISLFRWTLKRGTELEFYLGLSGGFFHGIDELTTRCGLRSFITHTWGINLVYCAVYVLWFIILFTKF